jgi:hypothetical protein
VVEHLPNQYKALNSNPINTKKEERKNGETNKRKGRKRGREEEKKQKEKEGRRRVVKESPICGN